MKNTTYKNLIIGNMIKEIATLKGVSSKEISNCIGLYQSNPHKIYGLDDMLSKYTITFTSQEVRFKNPDDNTLLMVFCRRDDEK